MAQENTLQIKSKQLTDFIEKRKDALGALAAKHMTPEKIIKGFMAASTRNPRLLDCTPLSVLNACIISAELGLDIKGRGGLHLVPFKNGRTGQYEVTVIPDYRGLMQLAYNSGKVTGIESAAVREHDFFSYELGTDSELRHKPAMKNRGEIIGFYAVAHMKIGRPCFEYMSVEEVDAVRARSKAGKDGPWVTDYEPMGRKTLIRRLSNYLPMSPETENFQRAVEMDGRMDAGESVADLFELQTEGEPTGDKVEDLKTGLKKRGRPKKEAAEPEPEAVTMKWCQKCSGLDMHLPDCPDHPDKEQSPAQPENPVAPDTATVSMDDLKEELDSKAQFGAEQLEEGYNIIIGRESLSEPDMADLFDYVTGLKADLATEDQSGETSTPEQPAQ